MLTQIVDRLAKRLRDRETVCSTVVLRLRYGDYAKATRSRTLGAPTDRTEVLLGVAQGLLAGVEPEISERGVTLIGVSFAQLGKAAAVQPELPLDWNDGARLDTALDAVRDKFGSTAVTRAALMGRDPGLSAPQLPEHE
jgi:DNA polymerase-4